MVASALIGDVKEGRNYVLFGLDDLVVLYERIGNTIHTGQPSDLSQLVSWLEAEPYTPQFTSRSLKEKPHISSQLVLNVTETCNLACKYCIYSGNYEGERVNDVNGAIMSPAVAFKAVDLFAMKAEKGAGIGFYGGEPTLAFGLIKKVVNYVNANYPQRNFVFGFTSNFVGVRPYLQYLVDNDFRLVVSIDGPRDVHDKQRVAPGNKPTFNKVIRNIQALRDIDPDYFRTHVGFSSVYASGEDFQEMVSFFLQNELFRDGHLILGPVQQTLLKDSSLIGKIDTEATSMIFNKMIDLYVGNLLAGELNPPLLRTYFDMDLWRVRNRGLAHMPAQLPPGGTCYPTDRKLFVNTDGAFYICEKMGARSPLGSVEQGVDFGKADKLLDEFTAIKNQVCNDCWAARMCPSCPVSAKGADGLSADSLLQSCQPTKAGILTAIGTYVSLIHKDAPKNYEMHLANLQVS